MKHFENLVLGIPHSLLRNIPYLWVIVILFWAWPPVVSGIFLGFLLLGLVTIVLQQRFWEAKVFRDYQKNGLPYRSHPRMPLKLQLRNVALLLAGSTALGFLLDRRLDMSGLQWFLLIFGLVLLYSKTLLFGAQVYYLVTPRGIAVRYMPGYRDYRLFFHYNEINYVSPIRQGDKLPPKTDVLSPMLGQKEGVLLAAKRMDGFSDLIGNVLLTPTDIDAFLAQIPGTLIEENPPAA
jgi:hypothetical protein